MRAMLRAGLVIGATLLGLGAMPLRAQEEEPPSATDEAPMEDVDALIARMRERLERMRRMAQERDAALRQLREQVERATRLIGSTSETTESLRAKTQELTVRVEELGREREQLESAMNARERLLQALEVKVAALAELLGLEPPDRTRLGEGLEALRPRLEVLVQERDRLAARVQELEAAVQAREQDLADLRRSVEDEKSRLAQEIQSLRAERDRLATRVATLEKRLGAREAQIRELTARVAELGERTRRLLAALAESEARLEETGNLVAKQDLKIAELTARLNEALARKVEELQKYRSEFFGRLREALGDLPDVRVVGDRFVLQSEILFPSGSAELEPEGRRRLEQIAVTLREIMQRIPEGIDWVLRVDGHTDRRPLRPDSPFRDNWELSTERANTVVRFLVDHGIPPEHLMAAGFGEFQPIDPRDTEEAYRRNRRIEFRLTAR